MKKLACQCMPVDVSPCLSFCFKESLLWFSATYAKLPGPGASGKSLCLPFLHRGAGVADARIACWVYEGFQDLGPVTQ